MGLDPAKVAQAPTMLAPASRTLFMREKCGSNSIPLLRPDYSRCFAKHRMSTETVAREIVLLDKLRQQEGSPTFVDVTHRGAKFQMFHGTREWEASHLLPAALLVDGTPPSFVASSAALRFHLNVNEARVVLMPRFLNRRIDVFLDLGKRSKSIGLEASPIVTRADILADAAGQALLTRDASPEDIATAFRESERGVADDLANLKIFDLAEECGLLDGPAAGPQDERLQLALTSIRSFIDETQNSVSLVEMANFQGVLEAALAREEAYEGRPEARPTSGVAGSKSGAPPSPS